MVKVEDGIVFSNDIYRILQGQNALDFDYSANGLIIPSKEQIDFIRADFEKDVRRIFDDKVTIFSEEQMEEFLSTALDSVREYPHCIFG